MPCRYDISYCRFCCSPINWPCTSPAMSLLLRLLLDADDPFQLCQAPSARRYVRSRRGMRSSCPPPPTSVPTGPPIRPLIPRGSRYFACFSSMKTRRSTCLSVTIRHAIINLEFGAIRRGGSKCLIPADEQVAALDGCLPSIRDSMCVGRDRVFIKCDSGHFRLHTAKRHGSAKLFVGTEYISLTQTRHGLSGARFPHPTATVARLY